MRDRRDRIYEAAVTLRRDEILLDVDFTSWKVAKCRITDNPQMEAEVSTDGEASDWIDRTVETAVDTARSKLGYAVRDHSRMQDNAPEEPVGQWTVVLDIQKEGWTGSIRSLKTYLHQYVVNFVLSKWFMMVLPQEVSAYMAVAEDCLEWAVAEVNKGFLKNMFYRW